MNTTQKSIAKLQQNIESVIIGKNVSLISLLLAIRIVTRRFAYAPTWIYQARWVKT